jgi:hypothetical protein
VSEQRDHTGEARPAAPTLEELARDQHAAQVTDAEELVAEIWESDEELDAFLADLRESRNASTV